MIERRPFSLRPFLSGMHTRGGYDLGGVLGFGVGRVCRSACVGLTPLDHQRHLSCGGTICRSGPRRWGWIALVSGAACFAVIIATL